MLRALPSFALAAMLALVACNKSGSGVRTPTGGAGSPAAGGGGRDAPSAGRGGVGGDDSAAGRGGMSAADGGGREPEDAGVAREAEGGRGGAGSVGNDRPPVETVYVGGYGPNITIFSLATDTGVLTQQGSVPGGNAPSYLAVSPDKKYLYAINEADAENSKVQAFAIAAGSGALTPINSAKTGGFGAPHLAVHPSGKWVAVAHYNSGQTSILAVRADGGVEAASEIDAGPNAGCRNAHQAVFDSSGKYLFVPCLGSNYVIQYKFDAGQLTYNDPATVAVAGGPRHMALDREEEHAYVLSEVSSSLSWFKYDRATGKLSNPQLVDSFQSSAGASAHLVIHQRGKWLYASNRAENSLAVFSIESDGQLSVKAFETEMIATPRDFSIDPSGTFLILANQNGAQNLLVYRIDDREGTLTRVQVAAVGGNPTFTTAIVLP